MVTNMRGAFFVMSVFSALVAISCGSKDKAQEAPAAASTSNAGASSKVISEAELLERHDLLELNGAATALRVIFDKSLDGKNQEPVLECEISGEQAQRSLMPLKSLIDSQIERERDEYLKDPAMYVRTRGLETCGSKCACGVFASVLESVSVSALKTQKAKSNHPKILKRLQTKAALQNSHESLACAKKQSWYCASGLKTHLEREALNLAY
jgi:hypothetical protein